MSSTKYTVSGEILLVFTNCCSISLEDLMMRDTKTENLNRCAMAVNEDLSIELRSSFVSFWNFVDDCLVKKVAQGGCGCPIPGSVPGQVGWGLEQPGLVEGVPAQGRGVATRRSLRSLPTQTILWSCLLLFPLSLTDSCFWQLYQVHFGKRNLKVFLKIISGYFTSV